MVCLCVCVWVSLENPGMEEKSREREKAWLSYFPLSVFCHTVFGPLLLSDLIFITYNNHARLDFSQPPCLLLSPSLSLLNQRLFSSPTNSIYPPPLPPALLLSPTPTTLHPETPCPSPPATTPLLPALACHLKVAHEAPGSGLRGTRYVDGLGQAPALARVPLVRPGAP